MHLFDHGVAAVCYVRCHGVQAAGGEEGVVSPQVEQSVLAVPIEFADAADHQPARHLLCLRSCREGDVGNLGYLSPRHPAAAALVIDGVPVGDLCPGILGDAADRGLDPDVLFDRDRHLDPGPVAAPMMSRP